MATPQTTRAQANYQALLREQAAQLASQLQQTAPAAHVETIYEALRVTALESWNNGRRAGGRRTSRPRRALSVRKQQPGTVLSINNTNMPKNKKGGNPLIVASVAWAQSLPEWLLQEIAAERMVAGFCDLLGKEHEQVGDAEVVAYLMTASLTAPLPHEYAQIYRTRGRVQSSLLEALHPVFSPRRRQKRPQ
jgi:hypothetical protein